MKNIEKLVKRVFDSYFFEDDSNQRDLYNTLFHMAKDNNIYNPSYKDAYDLYQALGGDSYIESKYGFTPDTSLILGNHTGLLTLNILGLVVFLNFFLIWMIVFQGLYGFWMSYVYNDITIFGITLDGLDWMNYWRISRIVVVIIATILVLILRRRVKEHITLSISIIGGFFGGLYGVFLLLPTYFRGRLTFTKNAKPILISTIIGLVLYFSCFTFLSVNGNRMTSSEFAELHNNEVSYSMYANFNLDDYSSPVSMIINSTDERTNNNFSMKIRGDSVYSVNFYGPKFDFTVLDIQENSTAYVSFRVNNQTLCTLEYEVYSATSRLIEDTLGYANCDPSLLHQNPVNTENGLFESWDIYLRVDYVKKDGGNATIDYKVLSTNDPYQYLHSEVYLYDNDPYVNDDKYGFHNETSIMARGDYVSYIKIEDFTGVLPTDVHPDSNIRIRFKLNNTFGDTCDKSYTSSTLTNGTIDFTCRFGHKETLRADNFDNPLDLILVLEYTNIYDELVTRQVVYQTLNNETTFKIEHK